MHLWVCDFCVLVGYDTCISVSLSQNSLLYIFFLCLFEQQLCERAMLFALQ